MSVINSFLFWIPAISSSGIRALFVFFLPHIQIFCSLCSWPLQKLCSVLIFRSNRESAPLIAITIAWWTPFDISKNSFHQSIAVNIQRSVVPSNVLYNIDSTNFSENYPYFFKPNVTTSNDKITSVICSVTVVEFGSRKSERMQPKLYCLKDSSLS